MRGRESSEGDPSHGRSYRVYDGGGVSYPPSGEKGLALPLHGALEMGEGYGANGVGVLGSPELGLGVCSFVARNLGVPWGPLYGGDGWANARDRNSAWELSDGWPRRLRMTAVLPMPK